MLIWYLLGGGRTTRHPDNSTPGQLDTRTTRHPDNSTPGQLDTGQPDTWTTRHRTTRHRTTGHPDNSTPGQLDTRTFRHQFFFIFFLGGGGAQIADMSTGGGGGVRKGIPLESQWPNLPLLHSPCWLSPYLCSLGSKQGPVGLRVANVGLLGGLRRGSWGIYPKTDPPIKFSENLTHAPW